MCVFSFSFDRSKGTIIVPSGKERRLDKKVGSRSIDGIDSISIGKNVGTCFRSIDGIDGIDRWDRGPARHHRGARNEGRSDARRANDDVAVCPGTAETKPTGRRTGTTECASENGDDDDDDGGGGCDSQRRCVDLYCFCVLYYFIVWGCQSRDECILCDR